MRPPNVAVSKEKLILMQSISLIDTTINTTYIDKETTHKEVNPAVLSAQSCHIQTAPVR